MSLYLERLGNSLIAEFKGNWKNDNPKLGEEERTLYINGKFGSSPVFITTASALGLNAMDYLRFFPEDLAIGVNPGCVFVTSMQNSLLKRDIWTGSVDSDGKYSQTVSGISVQPDGMRGLIAAVVLLGAPYDDRFHSFFSGSSIEFPTTTQVPLDLVHPAELSYSDQLDATLIDDEFSLVFRFTPPDYRSFTAGSFKNTRFRSFRPKPDREGVRRIQMAAYHEFANDNALTAVETLVSKAIDGDKLVNSSGSLSGARSTCTVGTPYTAQQILPSAPPVKRFISSAPPPVAVRQPPIIRNASSIVELNGAYVPLKVGVNRISHVESNGNARGQLSSVGRGSGGGQIFHGGLFMQQRAMELNALYASTSGGSRGMLLQGKPMSAVVRKSISAPVVSKAMENNLPTFASQYQEVLNGILRNAQKKRRNC